MSGARWVAFEAGRRAHARVLPMAVERDSDMVRACVLALGVLLAFVLGGL